MQLTRRSHTPVPRITLEPGEIGLSRRDSGHMGSPGKGGYARRTKATFSLVALGLWVVLLASPIWGQEGGTPPPTGGGGATAPSTPPPSTPTPTPSTPEPSPGAYSNTQDTKNAPGYENTAALQAARQALRVYPDMTRWMQPVFLQGRVLLESGAPPPETVAIEIFCNGQVSPLGYTDSKGRFAFEPGSNLITMNDSSDNWAGCIARRDSWSPPSQATAGCDIRASLPGYRSDVVPLAGIGRNDDGTVGANAGVIVLHRQGNVNGTPVSMVSLQAPKNARKAYEKGRAALQRQNWKEARKQYEKAVGLYPRYAAAWSGLGAALERLNDSAGAWNAYAQASIYDPPYVYPHIQLAGLAAKAEKWPELLDATNQALKLDPLNYPDVYFYNAVAQLNLGNIDLAENSAREGLKIDTERRFPKLAYVLGVVMEQKRDFPAALGYMRSYLESEPQASNAQIVKKHLAEVERLAQAR